jgi:hypothetical protein
VELVAIDKIEMIYNDLQELKKDIKELKEFKNRLIGAGIILSAFFAFIFDMVKSFFTKS